VLCRSTACQVSGPLATPSLDGRGPTAREHRGYGCALATGCCCAGRRSGPRAPLSCRHEGTPPACCSRGPRRRATAGTRTSSPMARFRARGWLWRLRTDIMSVIGVQLRETSADHRRLARLPPIHDRAPRHPFCQRVLPSTSRPSVNWVDRARRFAQTERTLMPNGGRSPWRATCRLLVSG